MRCARCRAHNCEEAAACSLCHQPLRPKAPAAVVRVTLPWVETEVGGWRFSGPAVFAAEGLYCFVKEAEYRLPWPARLAAKVLGGALGAAGGPAIDRVVDLVEEAPRRLPGLRFGHRLDIPEVYDRSIAAAPEIAGCSEYFLIRREDVRDLEVPWADVLTLRTGRHAVELRGELPVDELSGRLVLWGYPLERGVPRGRFPLRRVVGAVAAVVAVGLLAAEVYDVQAAGAWLSSLAWVRAIFFREDHGLDTVTAGAVAGAALFLAAVFRLRGVKPDA